MLKIMLPLVLSVLVGCGDQSLPRTNLAARTSDEITAHPDCRSVSFNSSPLEYQNTLKLFNCLAWSKAYPKLYSSIQGISQHDWNHLFTPVNDSIFNQEDKRVQLFSRVAALKIGGGFDQLNSFLDQLSKHKSIISTLIKNIKALNKSELDNLFNTQNISDENVKTVLNSLATFDQLAKNQKSDILQKINNHHNDTRSIRTQLDLVDSLVQELDEKNFKYLLDKFKSIDKDKQFSSLFRESFLTREQFKQLLLLTKRYPNLQQGIKYVDHYWDNYLVCKNSNKIKFGVEVPIIMNVISEGKLNSVFDSMIDSQSKLLIFNEVCPLDNQNIVKSMIDVHSTIIDLLSKESTFSFISLIHQEFYSKTDERRLVSFFSSKTFEKSTEFLAYHHQNKDIIDIVYDIFIVDPELFFANIQILSSEFEKSNLVKTFEVIRKIWLQLSQNEQVDFLSLIKSLLHKEFSLEYILNYWSLFFAPELGLLNEINQKLWSDQQQINTSINSLINMLGALDDAETMSELISFFKKDNLITILRMFSMDISPIQVANELLRIGQNNKPVSNQSFARKIKFSAHNISQINCLKELTRHQGQPNGLTRALNIFHKVCPEMQNSSLFIPKINHNLAVSNAIMQSEFQVDFLRDVGLFSNDNVNLYLKLILKGNMVFQDVGGIKNVIAGASQLTQKNHLLNLLKPAVTVAQLYLQEAKQNWLNLEILKKLWNTLFQSIKNWFYPVELKLTQVTCSDYASFEVTRIECDDLEFKQKTILKTLEVLGQKDKGSQLYKSILSLFDPAQGVHVPFARKNQVAKNIDIKGILTLLYDLGSESTIKTVIIKDGQGVARKFKLNLLQRLEVVIRDISFLNNYYGSHFKNEVAAAKDYQQKVKALFKQLKIMENSSKTMVRMGLLPSDAIFRLENIRETYSSLIEAGDTINNRNHSLVLQAIIAATVESSEERAQSFNPYRIPQPERTIHHKGKFLTYFSELNGMSALSNILHKLFETQSVFESMLKSDNFKNINKNLLLLISHQSLGRLMEILTYEQLDRGDKLTNRLVLSLLERFEELNNQDSEKLLLIFTNFASVLSRELNRNSLDVFMLNAKFYLGFIVNILESKQLKWDSRIIDLIYRISLNLKGEQGLVYKLYSLFEVANKAVGGLRNDESDQLSYNLAREFSALLTAFSAISTEYSIDEVKDVFVKLNKVFAQEGILDDLGPIINKMSHDNLYKLTVFINNPDENRLKSIFEYLFVDSLDQINQMIDTTLLSVE